MNSYELRMVFFNNILLCTTSFFPEGFSIVFFPGGSEREREREKQRNSSGPPKPSVIHLPVLKDLDSMRAKK